MTSDAALHPCSVAVCDDAAEHDDRDAENLQKASDAEVWRSPTSTISASSAVIVRVESHPACEYAHITGRVVCRYYYYYYYYYSSGCNIAWYQLTTLLGMNTVQVHGCKCDVIVPVMAAMISAYSIHDNLATAGCLYIVYILF